jgi:hypothetical protein
VETPTVDIERDKYAHVHPLVRKYASLTRPELKMGEPRWANAVLSRRWQEEETLEDKKRELKERKEKGIPPSPPPQTCMTKGQHEADQLAQQVRSLLQEYSREMENTDMEKQNDIADLNEVKQKGYILH